jgi:serine protease Do
MTQHDNRTSLASQFLRPRRAMLLASVAGVGIAALVSGTSLYHPSPLTLISPAAAAENMVPPSGFADLVARVKPAVISVRVRFNDSARVSSFNQKDDNAMPSRQGSPFDRFFRQFGFQNMPNGMQ